MLLIILGPVTYGVGTILLRRALARARANPVTSSIVVDETM